MTRRFFRKNQREEFAQFNAAESFLAAAHGKDPRPREIKPKRVQAPRADHADLEKHTLSAVGDLLAVHPKVLFAVRQNSGGMQWADAKGEAHSMWFYRIVTKQPVRISDYWGILRDGRMLAMECKRPSWKAPADKREYEQAAFLMLVRNCGGIAGFVRNADEAMALLP